jgi:flavin-dependent dehydrogenase
VLLRRDHTEQRLHPRWILVADGLGGTALRGLAENGFARRREPEASSGAGLFVPDGGGIDGTLLPSGVVRMCVGSGGYVGIVRGRGGYELAAALRPGAIKRHGGASPAAEAVLADAEGGDGRWSAWLRGLDRRDTQWAMTPALTTHRHRVAAPGLMVLGDAAGYLEPFTGEGITWALAAADAATDLVRQQLHGQMTADAVADAWQRRHVRRQRFGRLWCRGTRRLLRHPVGIRYLTRLAGRPTPQHADHATEAPQRPSPLRGVLP